MKFRTKLILGFSIVIFLISAILGAVCYNYNSRRLSEKAAQSLRLYSRQTAANLDFTIDSMKHVTDYILSDPDMLSAMKTLPRYYGSDGIENSIEHSELVSTLNSGISTYYIAQNFYRVVIFNKFGDVASSTNSGSSLINKKYDTSKIEWLDDADEMHGLPILIGPHADEWGRQAGTEVFSLARKVQGGDFGYIEVQYSMEKLKNIVEIQDPDIGVVAFLDDGQILYQSDNVNTDLMKYIGENPEWVDDDSTSLTCSGNVWSVARESSENYGIKIVAFEDNQNILAGTEEALIIAFAFAIGCFVISMAVVIFIASKLSRPLTTLKNQIESTDIDNLNMEYEVIESGDEVEAVSLAYNNLIKRLNASIVKEKRMSLLQLQAQYDTLQAQVNPHFLYNVLNVISSRGIMDGDDEICEICGCLAAMLRYSTNNKERYATIEKELEYLDNYVFLLKSRYEHRLKVDIECEESLKKETVPKIVLQQLVENSIQHGYTNSKNVMEISVKGWSDEDGWYFEVRDNGQGVSEETRENLESKIELIRDRIMSRSSGIEMEIGGMGLANTYARMFLLYNDRVIFRIKNLDDGLSIRVGVAKEEEKNVSGNGC